MDEAISNGYVTLRKIIGRNDVTTHSIAFCHATNATFIVAGTCVEVTSPTFEGHLKAPQNHIISTVAVTKCGRYAATSEIASNAQIRIWEVIGDDGSFTGRLLKKLPANHQMINILKFTHDDDCLISVSSGENAQIIVWDWRLEREIASGTLMATANDLAISFDNQLCVTVGAKSIKYWFLPSRADRANNRSTGALSSRSAILADKRNSIFVCATFCDHKDRLMVVTDAGTIVEINNKKYTKTYSWTDPIHFNATCAAKISDGMLVGCSDGRLRLFSLTGDDLDFVSDVTSPAHHFVDPSMAYDEHGLATRYSDEVYSPVTSIATDPSGCRFAVGYADRTVIELSHQYRQWSFHSASIVHSKAVNSVESVPLSCSILPPGTFLTSGNDASLRFWNLSSCDKKDFANILFPTLLKVVYLDETENQEDSNGKGITCTRISSDGRNCAAATRNGKIYILDMTLPEMSLLEAINAHDAQVNCVDFSDVRNQSELPLMLASGSDDGIVHVFRKIPLGVQFGHCAVLDTHDSPITSVRFAQNSSLNVYTTAKNRTVAVWRLVQVTEEEVVFDLVNRIDFTCTVNELQPILLPTNFSVSESRRTFGLAAGCDDGFVRVLDQHCNEVNRVPASDKTLQVHKVTVDPTSTYVASVCSDKKVYVVDLKSGTILATLAAFTSTPTDVAFTSDYRSIIVTSSCGNVYQWNLAKNLTQKMVTEARRGTNSRSLTPDSLLGSGSEPVSEAYSIGRSKNSAHPAEDLGTPEFGSQLSLASTLGFDDGLGSKQFRNQSIPLPSTERVGDSSFSPQVQQASSVDRRTSSNLFGPESDKFSSDLSETQSDFVSSRRHWDLDPPRPNFSYLESEEDSSRSMINIRDAGMQRGPTAKELMMSHIAHVKSANGPGQPYQSSKSTMSSSPGRMRWGEMSSSNNNKAWPTSTTDAYGYRISTSPARQDMSFTVSATPAMVDMTPPPLAPRTTSRVFSTPPSQNALSKIQSVTSTTTTPSSAFRRKTMDRSSLSKKYLENGNSQPKTVWSPQTLATSSAPRRSNSNLFAAVQNAAREQGSYRRPDENSYTPSSALRSRSQSPNKIALGFTNRENAESTSNLIGGRDKGYQRRRDSEMSYMSRSVSRGPGPRDPEMRKSTDALNKLMASKNKLHQSSDNLRKSTDNLTLIQNQPETTSYGANRSRTRSSSNLRAGQLEPFTTFDADSRLRSAGSSTSLAHSRLLARSMTNLENGLATEGSSAAPGRRLANTIQMMKKASNSDLTQPEQYDDGSNQGALKIRGAVQKKVDRYKPRNRALSGRPQTSEESDSNNSDGYPLGSTGANNGLGIKLSSNRSTTNSSEFSPASSTRSSILGGALGSGSLSANRRLFENQKAGVLSTPRRSGNYLSQKLSDATAAHRTMEGPDLGSDESPRSSLNSLDFNGMVESSIVGRNPIVRHVQDCLEQLRINVDKSIQAKKLVEDDTTIPSDQKKIILGEIDKSIDTAIEKLAPKRSEEDNGNDYAPMKGQIYGVLKENLTSRQ